MESMVKGADVNAEIAKAKDLLRQWVQTSIANGCNNVNIVVDTEQFLKETQND